MIAHKGWDMEATAARKFRNPKSRMMQDGREILYGLDYQLRVREVLERDHYGCQWPCAPHPKPCGAPSTNHPHHIVKRSQLRDDRASNLMAICEEHHRLAHPEKQLRAARIEA